MSKSNNMENAFLALYFTAVAWADIAENDTTSPATSIYVALHTSDPGEAGSGNTNETSYGSYARQAVPRNSSNWTVTGNAVENTNAISFPQCTSGTPTLSHFSTSPASSGASALGYSGALAASLAVSNGVTPQFAAGALDITED